VAVEETLSGLLCRLRNPTVRDLAWSLFSPPMMQSLPGLTSEPRPPLDAMTIAWLETLDNQPETLVEEINQPHRLGYYFEQLWLYRFRHAPQDTLAPALLAHNTPVYRQTGDHPPAGQITLGAFDFLLQGENDGLHLEMAVKFYLGIPDPTIPDDDWRNWIGPDNKDRLDHKLHHLRDRQLTLSELPEGKEVLRKIAGKDQHWRTAACIKGYLFYPAHAVLPSPARAHRHHLRGHWWHAADFVARAPHADYCELPKARWLAPARVEDDNFRLNRESAISTCMTSEPGVTMLAQLNPEGCEVDRHLVMPDYWPTTASPSRST